MKTKILNVWWDSRVVGQFTQDRHGDIAFQYVDEWLGDQTTPLVCELTSVLEIASSHHAAGSSLPLAELVSETESLASTFAAVDDDNFASAKEQAARFLTSLERLRRESTLPIVMRPR